MINKTKADKLWKLLIVDTHTLQIVNRCCKVSDFEEKGISLIEQIALDRQPFPQMSGIYFIEPSQNSIDRLVGDFRKRLMYKTAHIFFTSKIPNDLMEKIKKSNLVKKSIIKTFVELNFDFYTIEKNLFSFEMKNDLKEFFTKKPGQGTINKFVERLSSVFFTCGEFPLIRYHKKSELSKIVAMELQNRLNNSILNKKKAGSKSVCLIVDRTFDMYAPLLHEFTYQAMIYDLLEVRSDNKYFSDCEERKQFKALLNENDPVFERYKFTHMMHLNKLLKNDFNTFKKANQGMNVDLSKGKQIDTKKIAHILHKVPEYQRQTKYYDLHIEIALKIQKKYKELNLQQVAIQEQNLATGEELKDNKSEKLENGFLGITPLLAGNIEPEVKMRLLLLYLIREGKITEKKKEKLFEMIGADEGEKQQFNNVEKYLHTIEGLKERVKKKVKNLFDRFSIKSSKEQIIDVSRYKTQISIIANDIVSNNLSEEKYPYAEYVENFKFKGTVVEQKESTSIKNGKAKPIWARPKEKKVEEDKKKKESGIDISSNKYKLFIFVIGGCAYNELRDLCNVFQENGIEGALGGTSVITPTVLMEKIEVMSN